MKLTPFVKKTDEGTACFVVEFMGNTYPVNPGQKTIKIENVVFPIDGEVFKGEKEVKDEEEAKPAKKGKK